MGSKEIFGIWPFKTKKMIPLYFLSGNFVVCLHVLWGVDIFVLLCSLLSSLCLWQYLVHIRCLVSICWMNGVLWHYIWWNKYKLCCCKMLWDKISCNFINVEILLLIGGPTNVLYLTLPLCNSLYSINGVLYYILCWQYVICPLMNTTKNLRNKNHAVFFFKLQYHIFKKRIR